MIVKARQPVDIQGRPIAESWAITEGRSYAALGLRAGADLPVLLQVLDNEENASFWRVEMFEVLDPRIPTSWAAYISPNGVITLGPAAWSAPDFLDRAYNDDPVAQRVLESGKQEARDRLRTFESKREQSGG